MISDPKKRNPVVRWVVLILIAVAIGLLTGLTNKYLGERPQRLAMDAADRFVQRAQPLVSADARFANVELSTFSGDGGCVLIYGWVSSDADLAALHQLIGSQPQPEYGKIVYTLKVSPAPATTQR